ncbi:hypothetical protein, partial [Burkholderia gladioli]|uniref:hypothetical protein n=1 Tax=Burkholderia gladioli TaxID=28095 RepID=UPI001ABAED47
FSVNLLMVDGLLFAGFRLRQSDSQLKPPPPSILRLNPPYTTFDFSSISAIYGLPRVYGQHLPPIIAMFRFAPVDNDIARPNCGRCVDILTRPSG